MPTPLPELLSRDAILAHLGADAAHIDIDLRDACESSNTVLLAAPPAAGLRVLACETQTAGRGRRGRSWQSWPGGSLMFSIRADRPAGPNAPAGLSLAAGLAVAETLESFGCAGVKLKWPNDILIHGAKAGGILVELAHSGKWQAVVIGIGLNLLPPPAPIDDIVMADIFSALPTPPSRNLLLARLLQSLARMLHTFDRQGFAAFREQWQARNAHAMQEVVLLGEGQSTQGRCAGVDHDGALLLDTGAGRRRVLSGDVSLRSPS